MRKALRAAAVLAGMMASGATWAQEEDDGDELPSLVAERVRSEFPHAKLASANKRGDWWEASVVEGVQRHDLLIDAFGNVAEHREVLSSRDVPHEIRASVGRSHPRHTLWRVTRITAADDVFHEVLLTRGEQRVAVLFDPANKMIAGAKGV